MGYQCCSIQPHCQHNNKYTYTFICVNGFRQCCLNYYLANISANILTELSISALGFFALSAQPPLQRPLESCFVAVLKLFSTFCHYPYIHKYIWLLAKIAFFLSVKSYIKDRSHFWRFMASFQWVTSE